MKIQLGTKILRRISDALSALNLSGESFSGYLNLLDEDGQPFHVVVTYDDTEEGYVHYVDVTL